MIKSYSEFINEEFSMSDRSLLKSLMSGTLHNIDTYGYSPEYCETNLDGKTLRIRVSARMDCVLSECSNDITVMVLPSNYNPNALVSLERGSYSKDATLDKFESVKDEGVCGMFRELYDDSCSEYGKLNMIIITLVY